jgi:hypothetical protein
MNRITHADVVQHNGPRIHMLALALVSTFFGATNDATANGITCKKGDYVALEIDVATHNATSFLELGAQMVPGDPNRNPWETFTSMSDTSPALMSPPGAVQHDGQYTGIYEQKPGDAVPHSTAWPHYRLGVPKVYFVARATRDVTNGHLHLVRN